MMDHIQINETNCQVTLEGKTFVARGAYVDDFRATVYVERIVTSAPSMNEEVTITDFEGNKLGRGQFTSIWRQENARTSYTMVAVKFKLGSIWYSGRYSPDYGNLVSARRTSKGL